MYYMELHIFYRNIATHERIRDTFDQVDPSSAARLVDLARKHPPTGAIFVQYCLYDNVQSNSHR